MDVEDMKLSLIYFLQVLGMEKDGLSFFIAEFGRCGSKGAALAPCCFM